MKDTMKQTVYRGNGKKAVVTRFQGVKKYSTAFFRREDDLSTSDVHEYTRLSWAHNDAKSFVGA